MPNAPMMPGPQANTLGAFGARRGPLTPHRGLPSGRPLGAPQYAALPELRRTEVTRRPFWRCSDALSAVTLSEQEFDAIVDRRVP